MFNTILLFLALSGSALCDFTTTIQPENEWGVWDGWGCSLCWWANVLGDRDDLADVVFTLKNVTVNGTELPGLGMNIARYNLGGSSSVAYENVSMVASPNIPSWKQIQGYWLNWNSTDVNSSSWDWSVDAAQRSMLGKARDRGASHFQLFSNSPMWWMLYNYNPSGSPGGATDNLKDSSYDAFAYYLAATARHAMDYWNITFDSVEAFNEPIANWWRDNGTQEGCHFEHSTQAQVVALLRQHLDKQGLQKTRLAASDENSYDMALTTWTSFNTTTSEQISQVDVHGYEYTSGPRNQLYKAINGTRLWNSEFGDGDATGLNLATSLNLDLRYLHPTAWNYWQPFDGYGWGLLTSNVGHGIVGSAVAKYYVVAHYTRHIRPGMIIIDGGNDAVVAAIDKQASRLIIVAVNVGAAAQTIKFDLTAVSPGSSNGTRWVTNVKGIDKYVRYDDVQVISGVSSVAFDAYTIQSFQFDM